MAEYEPVRRPLADQMYDLLLGQFMDGVRAAGEPLNIGALSRELSVSQTPLREALARLEHTGLVRREALRGYRVAPMMSLTEVRQLMEARLLLEPQLAAAAARRTTPEFVASLEETVVELEGAVGHADREAEGFRVYWRSDDRFHMLIAEHAGNPFLESAYRALGGEIQRFRLFSKMGRTGAKWAAPEHRAVFTAIAAHEPEAAAAHMAEHISGAAARILNA
ncbi:GntR family transcriptional regulator [Mycolicibacterium frederiksbergense]|uniref:GntR family transcriptional regulator n=1 Tax=Mycolicibacterium frederiksbergense TaxID=117567 RepID=UPI0024757B55|nr:GntR family transcriptional regulator [Mycolicibacterium frederiksbergense]